jgi:uncharacterized protein
MQIIGHVESLWRYPVKSMRGEELQEIFAGFAGVYGDRAFAFHNAAAHAGFPYFTGREQEHMLLYLPRYRNTERMSKPLNLSQAEALGSGVTPIYASPADFALDVETPQGELVPIDDTRLIEMLKNGIREAHQLTLLRSERAMTDCRPVSLLSMQTVRKLAQEVGVAMDKRRFRSNIYAELLSEEPFGENKFVGATLRIGAKAVIAVVGRDSRCKMITLDPDTAEANPDVMRAVSQGHEDKAGVYAVVLAEGMIRAGDEIALA